MVIGGRDNGCRLATAETETLEIQKQNLNGKTLSTNVKTSDITP